MIWDNFDKRSMYFWGVGVGLLIAWVTSGLAYWKGGQSSVLLGLTVLEFVASAAMFLVAFLVNPKKK